MDLDEINKRVTKLRKLIDTTKERAQRYREDPIWVQTCNGILHAIEDQLADVSKGTPISNIFKSSLERKVSVLAEVASETADWLHRGRHPEDWEYEPSREVAQSFALVYRDCLR